NKREDGNEQVNQQVHEQVPFSITKVAWAGRLVVLYTDAGPFPAEDTTLSAPHAHHEIYVAHYVSLGTQTRPQVAPGRIHASASQASASATVGKIRMSICGWSFSVWNIRANPILAG